MKETMEISQEALQTIGSYVKGNLADWIREISPSLTVQLSPEVTERLVRIEDSIDKQQALMEQGFAQMEKRFEQVDKRFEELRIDTNARFDETRADMNARFEEFRLDTNARFEEARADTNARFDETRADMNARFDQLHKQNQRQTSIFGLLIGALTLVVAYGTFIG